LAASSSSCYAIRQIFKPGGIYGNWGWRGLTACAIGIVAMTSFAVTAWFTVPIAAALALFVGLAASAVAYVLLARSIDHDREQSAADEDMALHGEEAVRFGPRA
jgi:O-antigen ligase